MLQLSVRETIFPIFGTNDTSFIWPLFQIIKFELQELDIIKFKISL